MKFRTVISLKKYKHSELIEALRDVVDGERGAYISDLAAEALEFKRLSRYGLGSSKNTMEISSNGKTVLGTSCTSESALQGSSKSLGVTQFSKPPNPLAFARPKKPI